MGKQGGVQAGPSDGSQSKAGVAVPMTSGTRRLKRNAACRKRQRIRVFPLNLREQRILESIFMQGQP